jgi:hypothetical protein
LLGELKKRFQNTVIGPYQKLGDIALTFIPFFRIYYEYYNNF